MIVFSAMPAGRGAAKLAQAICGKKPEAVQEAALKETHMEQSPCRPKRSMIPDLLPKSVELFEPSNERFWLIVAQGP